MKETDKTLVALERERESSNLENEKRGELK